MSQKQKHTSSSNQSERRDSTSPMRITKKESVDHPPHYGGKDNPYEVIKVIRAWQLDFWTGNAIKYIGRAGKKDPDREIEDLKKARWYLDDKIQELENTQADS